MKSEKKRSHKRILIILGVLTIGMLFIIVSNLINSNYENLSNSDKKILYELDEYNKANSKIPIWEGFYLDKTTVLAIDGAFGKAFLINPKNDVNLLYAKKISMPKDFLITVYRISPIAPQLLPFRFPGNFNIIGRIYKIFGNEVYYTKYDPLRSVESEFNSNHYITFLSHEAFHYYMQTNWAGGSRFSTDSLTKKDLELLGKEYEVLGKIQNMLLSKDISRDILLQYTKEYVDIVSQRISINPKYLKDELSMETSEGTASYIGIKASEIVGYDFGIMYFDNAKNISFSEIMPILNSGKLDNNFLANRMPYETGALLCMLLDALDVPDWQKKLNNQTLDNPVTLFSIIKEYSETN